jgi:pyrimidine deaminase RibD-like protein
MNGIVAGPAHIRATARYDGTDSGMPVFTEHELARFMAEALDESRKALPACRPNPPVGCVIVREGTIVARGFTGAPGAPHAEAAALDALGSDAAPDGLALCVTLEPCAFVGRTPSCATAIVDSGIRTVFVGTLDPDPRNDGAGIEIMRRAGILVRVGVLEAEVLEFIGPYLHPAPRD